MAIRYRLAAFVVLALCVTGCRPAVPAAEVVPPLALPDLSEASELVRSRIRNQYEALSPQAADTSRSPEERGAAFGAMGMVLVAVGYMDAAEAALLNARALAVTDPRWPYYLGYVHRQRAEPVEAAGFFAEALERKPNDVPALTWLGDSYLAAGRYDAAEEPLRTALTLDAGNAGAAGALGRLAVARRDHTAAVRYLEQALAIDPGASSLHYPLSMAYRGLGNIAAADRHLHQRGDIQPRTPDPLLDEMTASFPNPDSYDAMARAAIVRGDWTSAVTYARQGIELAEPHTLLRASLEMRLGTALAQQGKTADARQAFERSIVAAPAFAQGHYMLGVILMAEGRTQEAIERFSTAVELEPEYPEARLALARALPLARPR